MLLSRYFCCIALLLIVSHSSNAQSFSSSQQQITLIELYTSEGCRGCPSADKWLGALQQKPGLWSEFIPIAFHVGYWDSLAWSDRFADDRFNHRQYGYARNENLHAIYTPAIIVAGQEWRRRPWRNFPELPVTVAGNLSLTLASDTLNAQFDTPMSKHQTLVLNIALLAFDLKSQIQAGENKGKTLTHNFVAVGYRTVAMQPGRTGFSAKNIAFPTTIVNSSRMALVAWISRYNDPSPVQAVGGYLE